MGRLFNIGNIWWILAVFGVSAAVAVPLVNTAAAAGPVQSVRQSRPSRWVETIRFAIAANDSERDWRHLPPQEQKERLRKWRSLSPGERRELRDRMERFKQMPDADRRLYERRYQQWKRLPPAERRRLRQKLDRWDSLSPEEQEAIRRRFRDQ